MGGPKGCAAARRYFEPEGTPVGQRGLWVQCAPRVSKSIRRPLPLPRIRPPGRKTAGKTGRARTDGASRSARLDDEGKLHDA